jgi:lipopolysaccharide export system protein LptA
MGVPARGERPAQRRGKCARERSERPVTRTRFRFALLLPVLAGVSLLSGAWGAPGQNPPRATGGDVLEVTAEKLDLDVDQGTAVLAGKVEVRWGELTVECPRVDVRYDGVPNVRHVRGTGGIKAAFREVNAKAHTVDIDVEKRQVTLAGGVEFVRGRGWVRAERATVDLVSHKVSLQAVSGSIPVQPLSR